MSVYHTVQIIILWAINFVNLLQFWFRRLLAINFYSHVTSCLLIIALIIIVFLKGNSKIAKFTALESFALSHAHSAYTFQSLQYYIICFIADSCIYCTIRSSGSDCYSYFSIESPTSNETNLAYLYSFFCPFNRYSLIWCFMLVLRSEKWWEFF